jgi:hypothetical protein
MSQDPEEDGPNSHSRPYRAASRRVRTIVGSSSEFYFRVDRLLRELANPNLHDIPTQLPFRVEMWDRHDQHIRWVIAASASVAVGHAALDAAIAAYPGERFTLLNGILVIRQHTP